MSDPTDASMARAYLDLVQRVVTNYLGLGAAGQSFAQYRSAAHYDAAAGQWRIDRQAQPHTLLTKAQLDLLERLALDAEARGVAGDWLEAGVWRGGVIAFLRAVLRAHGIAGRRVIAADSFAGIPMSEQFRHDPVDLWPDRWVAGLDEVRDLLARLDLLDDRVEFLPGPFAQTLPQLAGRRLALIRIDADSHDSTMAALTALYPLLEPGGVVVIDDWHLLGAKLAVEQYRAGAAITEAITVEAGNAWWIKAPRR